MEKDSEGETAGKGCVLVFRVAILLKLRKCFSRYLRVCGMDMAAVNNLTPNILHWFWQKFSPYFEAKFIFSVQTKP